MTYHHQNLTDGKLPLWRRGRAWWGPLAWEWSIFRRYTSFGIALGLRGFSIRLGPLFAIYVHGRRDDAWDKGEFEICFHDGCIWIYTPWVDRMGWSRDAPWWTKVLVLHVDDWLLGKERCVTVEKPPFQVYVPMLEGSYRATATPKMFIYRRRWYVPMRERESVWLDIPGGIPHSGKGENSWDCGDDGLWGTGGDTVEEAIGNAVTSVLKSRRRHGHDSKNTGRAPSIVMNEQRA